MQKTYWNGEPCIAVRGTAIVQDCPEFPFYWARALVGKPRKCVRITYEGHIFYIDNEEGLGWAKVTGGKGSPNYGHSALQVADFKEESSLLH